MKEDTFKMEVDMGFLILWSISEGMWGVQGANRYL